MTDTDNLAVIPWSPYWNILCGKWNVSAQKCMGHFPGCFRNFKYVRFQVSTMLTPRIWSSGMLCCVREDKNPRLYINYKSFILLARNIFLMTISSPW